LEKKKPLGQRAWNDQIPQVGQYAELFILSLNFNTLKENRKIVILHNYEVFSECI